MSLSISDVVNVQLQPQAQSAQRRDLSVVAIFTDDLGDAFNNNDARYIVVLNADTVANRFGIDSEAHKAALSLFSARPKLKTALIARYNKTAKTIKATANQLKGSTLSVAASSFKSIANGQLTLLIGGKEVELAGLSFENATDFNDIATVLTTALTANKIKAIYDETGERFILQAITAGAKADTKLGYAYTSGNGVYIGSMLRLEDGQADIVNGTDEIKIEAELPSDAMRHLENVYQNWYGAYFADTLTNDELKDAHSWIAAADLKVMGYTATRDSQLEDSDSNILKTLAKKGNGRLMVQYNNTGDTHAAAELMGVALSTVWTGQNTAKTVKFKQETSVTSDERITINEATKCRALGINFYTDYSGVNMLAEGTMLGGRFIDEVVGLDSFIDAVQKQAFTTLQATATKVPQTDVGQARLIGALNVIGNEYVRNGFLAGGIWRGDDIGELTYEDRLDTGYYFYSDSFDNQSIAEREARKMMPINCAIKLAGAGHFIDIIIQFNR